LLSNIYGRHSLTTVFARGQFVDKLFDFTKLTGINSVTTCKNRIKT